MPPLTQCEAPAAEKLLYLALAISTVEMDAENLLIPVHYISPETPPALALADFRKLSINHHTEQGYRNFNQLVIKSVFYPYRPNHQHTVVPV